jgi:hypothetical protein
MSGPNLKNLNATPHPDGNRIDLTWELAWDPPESAGKVLVKVMRREDRFPSPDDWQEDCVDGQPVLVIEHDNLLSASDRGPDGKGLRAETVYYYAVQVGEDTPYAHVAAMATGPYGLGQQLYDLLPTLYRRYDTALAADAPPTLAGPDRQRGPLRRFLDLPGGQLDQLYSFARAALQLHDQDRVDGRLLPLLAEWIGWRSDFRRGFQAQRNELRQAPYIQETLGTLPNIEATVKRLIGWDCRAKEFANNIFLSNQPERLNLWAMPMPMPLDDPPASLLLDDPPASLLSLDFAYEGRPSAVVCDEGEDRRRTWLFYHSVNSRGSAADTGEAVAKGSAIRYKTRLRFSLPKHGFLADLEHHRVGDHWLEQFSRHGLDLSLNLSIVSIEQTSATPRAWRIIDRQHQTQYELREAYTVLVVYCEWSASRLLIEPQPGQQHRHPSAADFAEKVWIFWDVYDSAAQRWQIAFRWLEGSPGPQDAPFQEEDPPERRFPHTVAYGEKSLWLFWQERTGTQWRLRYKTYTNRSWSDDADFVTETTSGAASETEDFFAVAEASYSGISTFWTQPTSCGTQAGRRRRRLFQKWWENGRWGKAEPVFPDSVGDFDDCEPAACVGSNGGLVLFWSSNRDGSYAIWRSESDRSMRKWFSPEPVASGHFLDPYHQRTPLPLPSDDGQDWLLFRSSAAIIRNSTTDNATYTLDTRYCGCTSVDTRNPRQIAEHRQFEDRTCYTYDTGPHGKPDNSTWYRRDTVGIYLRAKPDVTAVIEARRALVDQFLQAFLPIQVRLVFSIETVPTVESLYSGQLPLGEETSATMLTLNHEACVGPEESRANMDRMLGWTWVKHG